MWEKILDLIIKLLPFIGKWTKKESKKVDNIVNYINYISEIDVIAKDIKYQFNPTHVSVSLFHNGDYFNNGKSIQKISMVYEIANTEDKKIMRDYQNVPASYFMYTILTIVNDGRLIISDFKKNGCPDSTTAAMLEVCSVKSYYTLPIYDKYKRIIGLLTVYYTNEKRVLNESELVYLDLKTAQFSNIVV